MALTVVMVRVKQYLNNYLHCFFKSSNVFRLMFNDISQSSFMAK